MTLPSLVLWMNIEPWIVGVGLLAALATYTALRPRIGRRTAALPAEGWRLLAILAAVPAFLLGAELALWLWRLGYRAPLAFTALGRWLGALLLVAATLPPVVAWVNERRPSGRAWVLSAGLAGLGALLFLGTPRLQDRAWAALAAAAPREEAALRETLMLTSHRYLDMDRVAPVLDRALPQTGDVMALVAAAGTEDGPVLDADLRGYLLARLDAAQRGEGEDPGAAAVEAVRRLDGGPEAVLQAWALASPALRAEALDGRSAPARSLADGLANAPAELRPTILEAAYGPLARVPLPEETIDALAVAAEEEGTVGALATRMLLRDASSDALRTVVPRFRAEGDPVWELLLTDCPERTVGIDRLAEDADPAVAEGARALRSYVRQYCRRAAPPPGG